MKSIRIGNDIRIEWPIVLSGDVSKLQELDLTVEVRPSAKVVDWHNYIEQPTLHRGKHSVMMNGGIAFRPDIGDGKEHCHPHRPKPAVPYVKLPYHIEDNTLIAMWTADRQFAVGDYDIILYAHKNEGGQAVCDQYRFVRLVAHSAQADAPDDSGIEAVIAMQPVTLKLAGLSAYEVAVINGFRGTEKEWLESLKVISIIDLSKEEVDKIKIAFGSGIIGEIDLDKIDSLNTQDTVTGKKPIIYAVMKDGMCVGVLTMLCNDAMLTQVFLTRLALDEELQTGDMSIYHRNAEINSKYGKWEKLISGINIPGGEIGQVLTKTEDGYAWQDPQVRNVFPEGGEEGQVLKKTADGVEWADDNDTKVTVNNTLKSNSTTEALSAAQGKALKELIDNINTVVVDIPGIILEATSTPISFTCPVNVSDSDIVQICKIEDETYEFAVYNGSGNAGSIAGCMSTATTGVESNTYITSLITAGIIKLDDGNTYQTNKNIILKYSNDDSYKYYVAVALESTTYNVYDNFEDAAVAYIKLHTPTKYELPTATSSQLGGVKIGEGITVKSDGTISAADDVVSLTNLYAAKGDIAAMCAAGPFITNLYFINSPVTEGITAGIDTGDYYHLCVMKRGTSNYLETTCSNVADTFSSFDNMDDYFVITNTVLYLKNNVIYHVAGGTDAGYFVSNERGDILTNVASRFETLAEARAFMREKMLALPDIGIVKYTSEEYEGSVKDENTLYIIHG